MNNDTKVLQEGKLGIHTTKYKQNKAATMKILKVSMNKAKLEAKIYEKH
jgi:hypothetical protein